MFSTYFIVKRIETKFKQTWGRIGIKTHVPDCRNRDTDVENKRMDTKGGKWRGVVVV